MRMSHNPLGRHRGGPPRRGAILLVVLVLLALFAVIGLSFALYAEAEATAARIKREAADDPPGNYNPLYEGAIDTFLGQLLYDVDDRDATAMSGLRGHSLGRGRYGRNFRIDPTPANDGLKALSLSAYTGSGTISETLTIPGVGTFDRTQLANYAYRPGAGFIIDPEQSGFRATPGTQDPSNSRAYTGTTQYPTGGSY
ncbi:MAG: hypothetical protein ACRCZF_06475, partial [Gemmataceae bacterium]